VGFTGYKKDLFAIWTAHRPTYAATAIRAGPLHLTRKIDKAKDLKAPRLILTLPPWPPGWGFDPKDAVEIGRLAVPVAEA
jgi:pyruvate ferredoxin oxidoreductase beta subunit